MNGHDWSGYKYETQKELKLNVKHRPNTSLNEQHRDAWRYFVDIAFWIDRKPMMCISNAEPVFHFIIKLNSRFVFNTLYNWIERSAQCASTVYICMRMHLFHSSLSSFVWNTVAIHQFWFWPCCSFSCYSFFSFSFVYLWIGEIRFHISHIF